MEFTRRDTLALGMGAAALTVLPVTSFAASHGEMAEMTEFTGGAMAGEGGIELTAPEIAENGNTVPVSVSAPGAVAIMILASGNPDPKVVTFNFGEISGTSAGSTRIRLAGTQDVVAVAKMADGSFVKTAKQVKVTIGGCGG